MTRSLLKILHGFDATRKLILARQDLGEQPLPEAVRARLREVFGEEISAEAAVARIIKEVRQRGDVAVRDYTLRLDGAALEALEVPAEEVQAARAAVPAEVLEALALAAARVAAFHRRQVRQSWVDFSEGGMGQLIRPLDRVGLYIPGGRAIYPSTVIMTAVPARVAGVGEVVLATPPGPDGRVPAVTLAAAAVARVDRVFRIGGAQAIAALAYGTESVPRVDKICGPGGLFVVLAKRQVYGAVGIDALPGPTETLLVADEAADPGCCAADLLAQAEHDLLATAGLITTSARLAEAVQVEVAHQLAGLARREIAGPALEANGFLAVVDSLDEAMELANLFAPEHLCLLVQDPWALVPKVRHAGGVFLGESSIEALGDYVAGPSHVMPTRTTARFSSPLTVDDFVKVTSLIAANQACLEQTGPAAAALARAEGLTAHAAAIERRIVPPSPSPRRGKRGRGVLDHESAN